MNSKNLNKTNSNLFENETSKLFLKLNFDLKNQLIDHLNKFTEILFDRKSIAIAQKSCFLKENNNLISEINKLTILTESKINTATTTKPIIKIDDEIVDIKKENELDEIDNNQNKLFEIDNNQNKLFEFNRSNKSNQIKEENVKSEDRKRKLEISKRSVKKRKSTELNDYYSDHYSDEDDPEKLWCICKKPHNNRFMIRCSKCLYWYHGSCVGIKQSELKEKDANWFCKKCR